MELLLDFLEYRDIDDVLALGFLGIVMSSERSNICFSLITCAMHHTSFGTLHYLNSLNTIVPYLNACIEVLRVTKLRHDLCFIIVCLFYPKFLGKKS